MKINLLSITFSLFCLLLLLPLTAVSGPLREVPPSYPTGMYYGKPGSGKIAETMSFNVNGHYVKGLRFLMYMPCTLGHAAHPFNFLTPPNAIPNIQLNARGEGHLNGVSVKDDSRTMLANIYIKINSAGYATVRIGLAYHPVAENYILCPYTEQIYTLQRGHRSNINTADDLKRYIDSMPR